MCNKNKLIVKIEGIDYKMEARVLLRLFFNEESFCILNIEDEAEDKHKVEDEVGVGAGADVQDGLENISLLHVKVLRKDSEWLYSAYYYEDAKNQHLIDVQIPLHFSKRTVTDDELNKPGGIILKSQKILLGTCIVDVLSKVTGKKLPYGALTGIRPVKLAIHCIDDGMDKERTINFLIETTSMSEEKARLLYDVALLEKPYINADSMSVYHTQYQSFNPNVHLYIGIPFCVSRCLYCSFTSYPISRYESLVPDFISALKKELVHTYNFIKNKGLRIKSIYIGGGTPTALDNYSFQTILSTVNELFNSNGIEFTVEAGRPDTITSDKLQSMKGAGVTRISINPQTMNSSTLKTIGRNHSPQQIIEKYYLARKLGFNNINMDIIAGLPGENIAMFDYTLKEIEKMSPDSLTVHTMALKRASLLHDEIKSYEMSSDEVVEKMIKAARISANNMEMRPYYLYRQKNILANLENTGYSKPGYECLYNIHTMEECESIIAMGPGSISKFVWPDGKKIERTCNVKEAAQYIERIDEMLKRKDDKINAIW